MGEKDMKRLETGGVDDLMMIGLSASCCGHVNSVLSSEAAMSDTKIFGVVGVLLYRACISKTENVIIWILGGHHLQNY